MSVTASQKLWLDNKRLEAEVNRLRHDIERMQEIDSEHLAEIDKCNAICDSYADENQRFSDEIDRLRAENEILRDYISWLGFDVDAVIAEAKTASHLPASDQEPQKSS